MEDAVQTSASHTGRVPFEATSFDASSTTPDQEVNEQAEITTSMKIEFLIKAIEEVQETNRFLDTKAGILALFESSLLIAVISSLIDPAKLQMIRALISHRGAVYMSLLTVFLIGYVTALVGHILMTLRGVFPQESPSGHVALGEFEPEDLFYLHKLDQDQRIRPPLPEYISRLADMNHEDIAKEYVYELLKMSYVRKRKSASLALSFRLLNFLIIGILVLVFLLVLGGLL